MPLTTLPTDELPATANGVHAPPPEPEPELATEDDEFFSEELLARLRERDWLDRECDAGRLDRYYGEYVISANRIILAHHRDQGPALEEAEAKAAQLGIPLELLTLYFIPGDEAAGVW